MLEQSFNKTLDSVDSPHSIGELDASPTLFTVIKHFGQVDRTKLSQAECETTSSQIYRQKMTAKSI